MLLQGGQRNIKKISDRRCHLPDGRGRVAGGVAACKPQRQPNSMKHFITPATNEHQNVGTWTEDGCRRTCMQSSWQTEPVFVPCSAVGLSTRFSGYILRFVLKTNRPATNLSVQKWLRGSQYCTTAPIATKCGPSTLRANLVGRSMGRCRLSRLWSGGTVKQCFGGTYHLHLQHRKTAEQETSVLAGD
jgi:hypothetical protein